MDKLERLSYLVDVQADLSLYWLHRSNCRFCHALTQFQCVKAHITTGRSCGEGKAVVYCNIEGSMSWILF